MSDREKIEALECRVDELSGEVHNLRRELVNYVQETRLALRYLFDLIKTGDHPQPGDAVSATLVVTPLEPDERTQP